MTEGRGAAVAFAAALALTLLIAAPVVIAPGERLFGSGAAFAPADPNRDPLVVVEQLRTGHVPRPYLQPFTDLPGRALARLLGPVAAYNVVVLASFPLAAAAAYLLARHAVGSPAGAMVAALFSAFLPFHLAHAAHHPQVAQTQWLPLHFLALWRLVDRPGAFRAALLLAASAAVVLSNFYAGLIAAALTPIALVAYGIVAPHGTGRERRGMVVAGLVLAAAAAAGLLAFRRATPALVDSGAFAVPRSDLFLHSAKWWSYLVPPLEHPLAGPAARRIWAGSDVHGALLEQQVGVGWSILVLAAVPLVLRLRGVRTSLAARCAPVLAVVAAAALACSLSPERTLGPFTFVRPSALLYEVAPMFRAYARFGVVVGLMTTLLAGAGAAWLLRRPGAAGRPAAVVLLGMAVLEYANAPPWRWRDVLPTRAHRWLAEQAGPLRILDCVPPSRLSDTLAVPLVGHPVSLLGPPVDDCGEPRLGDKLGAMGYTHVVVRRDGPAGARLAAGTASEGLVRGPGFEDAVILLVQAARPAAYVTAMAGFHPREYEGTSNWRWMGQTGALRIAAARDSPEMVLAVEMKAFPGDRNVAWLVDGRRLGEVAVAAGWRRYELPLGRLRRGEATVTLSCREPAVVANDVLGNGDPRALALAVGTWRLEVPPP